MQAPLFRLLCVAAAGTCFGAAGHAAMYRCPSPFNDGMVVTNVVNEAAALARQCEPLQTRRTALDVLDKKAAPAAKMADDWMAAPTKRSPAAQPVIAMAPNTETKAVRIDAATQRARDTDRRRIIETELASEMAGHVSVQGSLSKSISANDAAQRDHFQQKLQRHATNIDALRRELSRLP
jgi:hypothetical protein